jgi:hypothetical protein
VEGSDNDTIVEEDRYNAQLAAIIRAKLDRLHAAND